MPIAFRPWLSSGCLAAMAVLASSGGCATAPVWEESGDTAFVNVTVLPMTGEGSLAGQTVVISDGRISAMGPSAELHVIGDTEIIDGTGKYLMPGVAEMHGHYPEDAESQFTRDVMFMYVANGVLMVRGMQGGPQHLPLRESIAAGEIVGPRLWVSAPMLHGRAVTDPAQAESLVREAAATGFDHLKVHEELSAEVYDAIAATAHEVGLPFSGHVTNYVGLYHALESGQQTIDHLDNYLEALVEDQDQIADLGLFDLGRLAGQLDDSRIDEVVAATVAAGAGVVPTMALWEGLFGSRSGAEWLELRPETRYMPSATVSNWVTSIDQRVEQFGADPEAVANILALRRRVLKALHEAGVAVLLGTDSPQLFSVPGFSIHHEMQVMVASGINPADVLRAGTRAVAEFYEAADEFGAVAPGLRADLVLLNADPVADIGNFADRAGVMLGGRWISSEDLDAELAEIALRAAAQE